MNNKYQATTINIILNNLIPKSEDMILGIDAEEHFFVKPLINVKLNIRQFYLESVKEHETLNKLKSSIRKLVWH